MQTNSDIVLVTAIQAHDEQAMEVLYTRYVTKLYNYFWYRVYDTATSEDLLSQTWLHIFDKIGTFDADKSQNVSGWMYSIAHHKLVDYFRKKKLDYGPEDDSSVFAYDDNLLETTNAKHLVEQISTALEDIHPHAKEIVLMKLREGMTHNEIATTINISEANSKKIFSRSIQYLQATYGDIIPFICGILWMYG